MKSLRARRIEHEAAYLETLISLNPGRIRLETQFAEAGADVFQVWLASPALSLAGGALANHRVKLVFPEYFPAVPIEAYLDKPVRHPNVHPESGFVCLWNRHSPGDTVVEALLQLQRVISGLLWNPDADHLMQPEAADPVALPFEPLAVPPAYYLDKAHARPGEQGLRRRLSPAE